MSTETKRTRLIKLGAEGLADALLELSARHDEAADLVDRLIATPQENVKRFKAKLSGLKRSRRFIDWRESGNFFRELEGLLADIKAGVHDPKTGVELVAAFFKCDGSIFERCDDSNGSIGDIFRIEANELFVFYASGCKDKSWIVKLLTKLYEQDDYGVRAVLVDSASSFLATESLRDLADIFWTKAKKEKPNSSDMRHWFFGVQSLARQSGNPALFEKATLACWPDEVSIAACQDIAQVYLETGDAQTALSWMEKIPQTESFQKLEGDRLLLSIYEKLNDRDKVEETAWRIFYSYRSRDNLEILIKIIGEDRRNKVLADQAREILDKNDFSYSDAAFLLDMSALHEVEEYVIDHAEHLNGDFYGSLLTLAKGMEQGECWLATVVIYRALLESIFERAQSKYYNHGVRYLKKIDTVSPNVSDWRKIKPHEIYKQEIEKANSRKKSFWSKYRG